MLIASSLNKDFGLRLPLPIFGPPTYFFWEAVVAGTLPVAPGGGSNTLPGVQGTVSDILNPLFIERFGEGDLRTRFVRVFKYESTGGVVHSRSPFIGGVFAIPGTVPAGTHTFLMETRSGEIIGYTEGGQTNTPGWDGQALSVKRVSPASVSRYSFDPQVGTPPFFTGLVAESALAAGPTVLPSFYLAAYEITGSQLWCWKDNVRVHGPVSWVDGDRLHIFHQNGLVRFYRNATELWSS